MLQLAFRAFACGSMKLAISSRVLLVKVEVCVMGINFDKRVLAACLIAIPLLPLGAYAITHHRHVSVEFYHTAMATMKDGRKLHAHVIKMNGNMMAAFPMHDLPDYLQQQIFVPGDQ
ncbi:MAG: hypothetical protein AB1508_15765 [Pseudomonadota bacterium]